MGNENKEPWMLARRGFLKLSAGAGLSTLLLGWANPVRAAMLANPRLTARPFAPAITTRSSAKNCLMVVLRGGPSHIDTFDIKVGNWTPDKLGVGKNSAGYAWPVGVMPKLAQRADKFSIVRSLQHQEVVHERAEYYAETGRRLNPGLRDEIPHIGAIVAMENEERRAATDIFPGFMLLGYGSYSNNGFLSASYASFTVDNAGYGIENLTPPDGLGSFERRRAALQLLNNINNNQTSSSRQSFPIFQDQAEKMMKDPVTASTFFVANNDKLRYGDNYFGLGLAVARNVFRANRGTRFIEVDQYGWDNHTGIYDDGPFDLPALSRQFDQGLSALLDDLASSPSPSGSGTLLDDTFIVVMGEFGRTVGPLTAGKGRDHYPYAFSGIFAGGGVKGGRLIGATDESGAGLKDFGWNRERPIHLPDIVTTIYSCLGIDWTKTISNTPSGRIYRYADPEAVGDSDSFEISPLF